MRLSGENREEGYCVYRIRETAFGGGTKLSAEDGFLQFMIERLFASPAQAVLCLIISVSGQEETLPLPVPVRFPRKSGAMPRERFPL